MKYICTRNPKDIVTFKDAVIRGLSKAGGLYLPEEIPVLSADFFSQIEQYSPSEIGYTVLHPFVGDSIHSDDLQRIITETLSFPIPVKSLTDTLSVLELFHGPTQAFKDVGARFMSRCLANFSADKNTKVHIIVATSGDTGSAVANGFYEVPGTEVIILYPKGKISPYQEYQMTHLGKNIHVYEVEGSFDDCQHLVKQALHDDELQQNMNISSANSINIARLLPQMMYYFLAYKQLKSKTNGPLVCAVPSGNLGNVCAGIIAKKMGLPISRFVAAHNSNHTFFDYLQTGNYQAQASVVTYSNAMDVGNPSNFERLQFLYKNEYQEMHTDIHAYSITDEATLQEMKDTLQATGYRLDPHGAVGKRALELDLQSGEHGVFLETAHPHKFAEIIQKIDRDFKAPSVDLNACLKHDLPNDYSALKQVLLTY